MPVKRRVYARCTPTLAGRFGVESRAGAMGLTIDLRAVTHLGSAGVKALADAYDRASADGTDCVLIAPTGQPGPPRIVAGPVAG